jgi:signal transduction histidine kinase
MSGERTKIASPHHSPTTPLRLRGPFLALIAILLVALGASAATGVVGISRLQRTLDHVISTDVQRLIAVTHVRRLFRSDLLTLHDLEAHASNAERDRERLDALRSERHRRLEQLQRLGLPEKEHELAILLQQHQLGDALATQPSQAWEPAIADVIAFIEARLTASLEESQREARIATDALIAASALAAAFAFVLGLIVLRRVRNASETLWRSEEQLRQAQKLESIGRVAGGVAHDFNNLLTGILGYTALLAADLEPGTPQRANLEGIEGAAARAAALTKQLLAFSRQQKISPRPTDLGALLRGMEKLLVQIVGPRVQLHVDVAQGLGTCLVDPTQVEQVLLNLSVNAQQAMPEGGQLRIELRDALLDERDVKSLPGVAPGRFVRLTVSDTGIGMSPDVQRRIFEPFFTTKPVGQGTGLGLAVVHGVVHQQGGTISVRSEVGRGTTFDVYWPVIDRSE